MADTPVQEKVESIANWLGEIYNSYMEIYKWADHARLTNGSAGFYIDVYPTNSETLQIKGERYGERIDKTCKATKSDLEETLSRTI